MSLGAEYLGAGSIGGSDQNPHAAHAYSIPITIASDTWLVAVESAWHNGVYTLNAGVFADNGGAPGQLLETIGRANTTYTLSSDDRWITAPLMLWVTAGTYHVAVQNSQGGGGAQLRKAAGAGHVIEGDVNSVFPDPDNGVVVTSVAETFSIRAVTVAEITFGPPTGLIAVAQSPTQIDLSWDAVTGADAYDVERDSTIVARVGTTTYEDTGLTPGTGYDYRVRPVRWS